MASTSLPVGPRESTSIAVDLSRYENAITIASANVPLARSASPLPQNPASGGGGVTALPAFTTGSRPTDVTTSVGGVSTPSVGIRPMVLAATRNNSPLAAPFGAATAYDETMGVSGSSSDSSGSGGNDDVPPEIVASGGGDWTTLTDPNVPGGYKLTPNPIPVGTVLTVAVDDPDAFHVVDTIQWQGGTDYAEYMTQSAADAAPTAQDLVKGVATNGQTYQFIVDAQARNYNLQVHVTYKGGGGGDSTLSFTSVRPDGDLQRTGDVPQAFVGEDPGDASREIMQLKPEEVIKAYTATPSYFGGNFMFFQTIHSHRSVVSGDGTEVDKDLPAPGPDDGDSEGKAPNNPLGYNVIGNAANFWQLVPLANGDSTTNSMRDSPYTSIPKSYRSMQIWDDFNDYLMFQPAGGVWIALDMLTWSWNVSATNNGGAWQTDRAIVSSPDSSNGQPEGDDAFPTWALDYNHVVSIITPPV